MQLTPLKKSRHLAEVLSAIDAGAYYLALDRLRTSRLTIGVDDVPLAFVNYLRGTSVRWESPELFAGTGFWDAPKPPAHISTNAKANYRFRHHLAFQDFANAARELERAGLHALEGEDPEFAAWAKANPNVTIADHAIFFRKEQ